MFVSLRESLDTSTPEGRRRYIHAAADAEYERALISMRTSEKMQALKRRGRKVWASEKARRQKAQEKDRLGTGSAKRRDAKNLR